MDAFASLKLINWLFSITECRQALRISGFGPERIYLFLSVLVKHLRIAVWLTSRSNAIIIALFSEEYICRMQFVDNLYRTLPSDFVLLLYTLAAMKEN